MTLPKQHYKAFAFPSQLRLHPLLFRFLQIILDPKCDMDYIAMHRSDLPSSSSYSASSSSLSSSYSSSALSTSPPPPSTAGGYQAVTRQMEVDHDAAGASSASCSLAQSAHPRPSRARQPPAWLSDYHFSTPTQPRPKRRLVISENPVPSESGRALASAAPAPNRRPRIRPPSPQAQIVPHNAPSTANQTATVHRCPFLECAKHNETFSGWTSSASLLQHLNSVHLSKGQFPVDRFFGATRPDSVQSLPRSLFFAEV